MGRLGVFRGMLGVYRVCMGCLEVYIRCIYMYNAVYIGARTAMKAYKGCIPGVI